MKNGIDIKVNPTYKHDEARFLLANSRYLMEDHEEPFHEDEHNPQWKVVLHKEVHFVRHVLDTYSVSMSVDDDTPWLNISLTMPHTLHGPNIVGAKELSTKESTIIDEAIQRKIEKTKGK